VVDRRSGRGGVSASTRGAPLHLDHVTDPALLDLAAVPGVSSVMFDASVEDDEVNRTSTAEVARRLHERGLLVEAELGAIGGKGGHTPLGCAPIPGRQLRSSPRPASTRWPSRWAAPTR